MFKNDQLFVQSHNTPITWHNMKCFMKGMQFFQLFLHVNNDKKDTFDMVGGPTDKKTNDDCNWMKKKYVKINRLKQIFIQYCILSTLIRLENLLCIRSTVFRLQFSAVPVDAELLSASLCFIAFDILKKNMILVTIIMRYNSNHFIMLHKATKY